jgi:hypothetical protein
MPDAAALNRALYYYDPDTTRTPERSYLSWYDTAKSRWRCWTWWSVSPWEGQELTGIDHRVDAVLSTGELFSTEGDEGRVYGRDGTLAASFPLTGLSFIEEASIDGTLRVLFSQYMYMNNSAWFAVYSIPTADLDTLKAQ